MTEQNQNNQNGQFNQSGQYNQNWSNGNPQMPEGQGYSVPNQGTPQWNYQTTQNSNPYQSNPQPSVNPMNPSGYQQPSGPSEASYQHYENNQRYAQSLPNGQQPPQKKSKAGIFVVIGLLLVLLIGGGAAYGMGLFKGKTNVDKLLNAIKAGQSIKQAEVYNEIKIDEITLSESEAQGNDTLQTMLNGAGLGIHSKVDSDKQRYDVNLNLVLKGIDVLDVALQQQGQEQILTVPKLFKGSLYFSADSLKEQLPQMNDVDTIKDSFRPDTIEKAVKYLQPAFDPTSLKSFKTLEKKRYLRRIRDRYNELIKVEKGSRSLSVNGQDVEIMGDVYQIKENLGEAMEFYFNLITELVQDDNFKPFVAEYLDRIISVAEKNEDVVVYNYISLISGENDFKVEWDDDIKSDLIYRKELILDAIDSIKEEITRPSVADESAKVFSAMKESGSELELEFVVDKIIKYSNASVFLNISKAEEFVVGEVAASEMIDSVKYHVASAVLATNADVTFDEFNKEDALDFSNADDQEMENLTQEVQSNLMEIIFSLGLF